MWVFTMVVVSGSVFYLLAAYLATAFSWIPLLPPLFFAQLLYGAGNESLTVAQKATLNAWFSDREGDPRRAGRFPGLAFGLAVTNASARLGTAISLFIMK